MLKSILAGALMVIALAGCDVASSLKEGMEKSSSAAAAIEKRIGQRPEVGFNTFNGALTTVTVQFSKVPSVSLQELEPIIRQEVKAAFQVEPSNLVIAFVFKNAA